MPIHPPLWGLSKGHQTDGTVRSPYARRATGMLPESPSLWAGPREAIEKQASLPYREAEPVGRRASTLRNEAYFSYVAMTKDEAQRRRWTSYEAVNLDGSIPETRCQCNVVSPGSVAPSRILHLPSPSTSMRSVRVQQASMSIASGSAKLQP